MAFKKIETANSETVWLNKTEGLTFTGHVLKTFQTKYGEAYKFRLIRDCDQQRDATKGTVVAFMAPTTIANALECVAINSLVKVTLTGKKMGRHGEYWDGMVEVDEPDDTDIPFGQ